MTKTTLTTYLKQYQEAGVEQLTKFSYRGRTSDLEEQATTLEAYFKGPPPRTVAEAQQAIKEQTASNGARPKSKPSSNGWG